eukprot:scaffold18559_cov76-Cyclotella_meneghiniana.AAC.2
MSAPSSNCSIGLIYQWIPSLHVIDALYPCSICGEIASIDWVELKPSLQLMPSSELFKHLLYVVEV